MARIETAPEVPDDFDRVAEIVQAVDVLATSPLIGRPVEGGKRELVIGHGSRGYIALYRYVVEFDTVFLLAVRRQSEAGHERDL